MNIYSGYMRMYVEYLYVPASHAIFSIATIFALLTSTPSASPSSTPSLLPFYSLPAPLVLPLLPPLPLTRHCSS